MVWRASKGWVCVGGCVCWGPWRGGQHHGPDKDCSLGLAEVHLPSVCFSGEATPWNALLATAHSVSEPCTAGRHPSTPAQGSRGPASLVGMWECSGLVFWAHAGWKTEPLRRPTHITGAQGYQRDSGTIDFCFHHHSLVLIFFLRGQIISVYFYTTCYRYVGKILRRYTSRTVTYNHF